MTPRGGTGGVSLPGRAVDVLVLAVQTSGNLSSLTVVVSDADLNLLSQYLGISDVYGAVGQ